MRQSRYKIHLVLGPDFSSVVGLYIQTQTLLALLLLGLEYSFASTIHCTLHTWRLKNKGCSMDPKDVIDLTGEFGETASENSEDEDLRRAIALSLENQDGHRVGAQFQGTASPPKQLTLMSTTVQNFLGLDRRKMEEERLARLQRKRKRSISPDAANTSLSVTPRVSDQNLPSEGNQTTALASQAPFSLRDQMPQGVHPKLTFHQGVVKKTWCFGYPRGGDDIKLEEIINKTELEAAVLSSFVWDFDWLFPKFDTKRTKFVLVMHAKEASHQQCIRNDFNGIPNVRLCFPPMNGIVNCMHSKLMLLFYHHSLRVVVPTANLVPFDWGEAGGVMENTVFIIDLPKKPATRGAAAGATLFIDRLLAFLTAMKLQEDVLEKLQDFDFSATSKLGFVHTLGGAHVGEAWKETGLGGLATALDRLCLSSKRPLQLDYVTSSVGNLDDEFMRSMYLACQGNSRAVQHALQASKRFTARRAREQVTRVVTPESGQEWKDNFRFYFPSLETVTKSKGGHDHAGTICFSEKWWNAARFPSANMRDCVSKRKGVLMHNKVSGFE